MIDWFQIQPRSRHVQKTRKRKSNSSIKMNVYQNVAVEVRQKKISNQHQQLGFLVFWLWLINYLLYEITFSILSHSAGLWRYFNLNSIVVLCDAMLLNGWRRGRTDERADIRKYFNRFFFSWMLLRTTMSILQFEWNSFWALCLSFPTRNISFGKIRFY